MLPAVVDNIFGFTTGGEGWGLHCVKERQNPQLFNCIKAFFSPKGPFMECIGSRLNTQGSPFKYEVPSWLLSTPISVTNSVAGPEDTRLPLGALEYFLYSFIVFPIHSKWNKSIKLHDFEESVYCATFCTFLQFYLFIDLEALNVLAFRYCTIRPFQQITMYQRNYFHGFTQEQLDFTESNPLPEQGLFWQSEAFIQIVCEILLTQYSKEEHPSQVGVQKPQYFSSFHSELMTLMSLRPSSCHIYLVRLFAKHLYHAAFNHMTPQSITTPYQQALWNKISNFHKQLANSLCQQPVIASNNCQNISMQLQLLLLHCFEHWPHDLSFEIVLETWLTAIQPWRYADSAQPCGSSSPLEPTDTATPDTPKSTLSHQFSTWVSFAAAQYDLYSIPLLLFLQRAVCMDLRVTRNAYMVHRVVKVLSQRGFKNILRSAEEALSQETYGNIKGDCIEVRGIMAKTGKISLWSPAFYEAVSRLIQSAQAAQFQVRASLIEKSETNEAVSLWGRLWRFVNNLLLENGNRELKHLHKCDQYLTEMITVLETFFLMDQGDLPNLRLACTADASGTGRLEWDDATVSPLLPVSRVRPNNRSQTPPRRVQFANSKEFPSRTTTPSDHPSEADCISARLKSPSCASPGFASPEHTSELTPFDRFQILMGQRKPDVRYTGDRDFLPPCSYEVPILVELLNVFSGYLNVWMRPRMVSWCSRSGFVGWAARQTLLPASSQKTPAKPSNSLSPLSCSDLNPKVSLRWLASYSTLVRVVILYFVAFALFGIRSPISFFVVVLATYLLCKFMQLSFQYTKETIIHYCSRQ